VPKFRGIARTLFRKSQKLPKRAAPFGMVGGTGGFVVGYYGFDEHHLCFVMLAALVGSWAGTGFYFLYCDHEPWRDSSSHAP
jgi:hypothetical protein